LAYYFLHDVTVLLLQKFYNKKLLEGFVLYQMMKLISNFIAFASFTSLLLTTMTDSFSSHHYHHHHEMTNGKSYHNQAATATTRQLMMTTRPLSESQSESQQSRREVLLATFSTAVAALVIAPNNAEAAASAPAVVSSNGFYVDPKHPDGLRLLRNKGDKDSDVGDAYNAMMTISDGLKKEITTGNVTAVEMVYEDIPIAINGNELTFHYTAIKGGPEDIVGKLSEDGKKLTFSDGNTWTKK